MSHSPLPVSLLDLRDRYHPRMLRDFIALYDRTFTIPSERENPAQWRERLLGEFLPPQPRTHLLIALPEEGGLDSAPVLGGLVFEYYRESRSGLLTYLVVEEEHRRRGIGSRLITRALEILSADAASAGKPLLAVFAETEDPARVAGETTSMEPELRLRALAGRAKRVAIPYVQPRLIGGSARENRLILLNLFSSDSASDRLSASVLFGFLHEFYRALGVADPEADPDFRRMRLACGDVARLYPIEKPEER